MNKPSLHSKTGIDSRDEGKVNPILKVREKVNPHRYTDSRVVFLLIFTVCEEGPGGLLE